MSPPRVPVRKVVNEIMFMEEWQSWIHSFVVVGVVFNFFRAITIVCLYGKLLTRYLCKYDEVSWLRMNDFADFVVVHSLIYYLGASFIVGYVM